MATTATRRRATAPQIKMYVAEVDPATAKNWLTYNTHNRPIKPAEVAKLVGIIERGEWVLNGDPVRFSKNETLLDGQHRLAAVVESGKTVQMLVIEGLEDETQETMDLGARRSLKDALVLRGLNNASSLAALISYWWRYENGYIRYPTMKPTIAQGLALLEDHPTLPDIQVQARRVLGRFRLSAAMLGACLYEFESIDSEATERFVEALTTGVDLKEGNAILALRRYLERQQQAGAGSRASGVVTHALFIKAWNAWRDSVRVGQLNWKASGMKAEAFPEPH